MLVQTQNLTNMKTKLLNQIDFQAIEPMSDKQMVELNGGIATATAIAIGIAIGIVIGVLVGGDKVENSGANSGENCQC